MEITDTPKSSQNQTILQQYSCLGSTILLRDPQLRNCPKDIRLYSNIIRVQIPHDSTMITGWAVLRHRCVSTCSGSSSLSTTTHGCRGTESSGMGDRWDDDFWSVSGRIIMDLGLVTIVSNYMIYYKLYDIISVCISCCIYFNLFNIELILYLLISLTVCMHLESGYF